MYMLELMKLNLHMYTEVKEIKSTFYIIHIIVIKRKIRQYFSENSRINFQFRDLLYETSSAPIEIIKHEYRKRQ